MVYTAAMPHKQPVVAVIPHYNMPETLTKLLKQVIEQKYDQVYVLDDHSTNCSVREVVRPFGSAVNLIVGDKNRGAGGNRNRILEVDNPTLKDSILHFIDADCELVGSHTPDAVRKLLADTKNAWFGGKVLNADGSWMKYNFFPGFTVSGFVGSMLQELVTLTGSRTLNKRFRRMSKGLNEFPDVFAPPTQRQVFAVSEANMIITYKMFADAGGYDPPLREREVIDLAEKLKRQGATCRFDPSVAVKHHTVRVRGRTRPLHSMRASWRIIKKYGVSWR